MPKRRGSARKSYIYHFLPPFFFLPFIYFLGFLLKQLLNRVFYFICQSSYFRPFFLRNFCDALKSYGQNAAFAQEIHLDLIYFIKTLYFKNKRAGIIFDL